MKKTDQIWLEKWANEKFSPINKNPIPLHPGCGTDTEPESSIWLASMCNNLDFEDKIILDYGCGNGRLCNFLSKRFKSFTYYGLEPLNPFGESAINIAKTNYIDPRVNFGFIGSYLNRIAIEKANIVILGSVFTHLPFSYFENIINKLTPILENGGIISFSIFLAEEYSEQYPSTLYAGKDVFSTVFYTYNQVNDYCKFKGISITESDSFIAQVTYIHRIFHLTKKAK